MARAAALAASSSRFFGSAFVSSERRRRDDALAISSTAVENDDWFACDGLLNPLIFLTNCSAADRISSSVMGGSKLKRGLIFLHMPFDQTNRLYASHPLLFAKIRLMNRPVAAVNTCFGNCKLWKRQIAEHFGGGAGDGTPLCCWRRA